MIEKIMNPMNLHAISSGSMPNCDVCHIEGTNPTNEPFVGRYCNLCDDTTQRDLYDGHALDQNDELIHIHICEDCLINKVN